MKDNQEAAHWQTKPRNKADFYAKGLNVLYTQSQWAVVMQVYVYWNRNLKT